MHCTDLTIEELMDSRREAVEESLHTISAGEFHALAQDIFAASHHPSVEAFVDAVIHLEAQTLHVATADRGVHILYSYPLATGVWYTARGASGSLEPGHLRFMKELVESQGRLRRSPHQ